MKRLGRILAVAGTLTAAGLGLVTSCSSPERPIPFFGAHQAGITTPQQNFVFFAVFDVVAKDREELQTLLKKWTVIASDLSQGLPLAPPKSSTDALGAASDLPAADTGEAFGHGTRNLSLTFGAGPGLFDGRFGLSALRPPALADLPSFRGDALKVEWSGGDLSVQACADDLQLAFHAIHDLARAATGLAVLRWVQSGFHYSGSADGPTTARNLMGFRDGTANPDVKSEAQMDKVVWAGPADGASWMSGGTYMVVRRIRIFAETWDRTDLASQQGTFGRSRWTGAPLGEKNEFDPLDPVLKKSPSPIAADSHVALAHGDGSEMMLRRGFSYVNGLDPRTGQWDEGLLFISFQRDPRTQFVPVQARLAASDSLNEYISHVGSGVFAVFPGPSQGDYLGSTLFNAKGLTND